MINLLSQIYDARNNRHQSRDKILSRTEKPFKVVYMIILEILLNQTRNRKRPAFICNNKNHVYCNLTVLIYIILQELKCFIFNA